MLYILMYFIQTWLKLENFDLEKTEVHYNLGEMMTSVHCKQKALFSF